MLCLGGGGGDGGQAPEWDGTPLSFGAGRGREEETRSLRGTESERDIETGGCRETLGRELGRDIRAGRQRREGGGKRWAARRRQPACWGRGRARARNPEGK